jgi:protein-S-isoprenylcysteine O-methyltransferase Ste14
MLLLLRMAGWVVCVVYSTIPMFWLMIHPRAHWWRKRPGSPFRLLVPAWVLMWLGGGALTAPWRHVVLYATALSWVPAGLLVGVGFWIYRLAGAPFNWTQLSGLPELLPGHREQRLVTTGIRARVRHPVYLGHLCEMLGWSVGTGLLVCWALTGFAVITGAVMIWMEDAELEKRFGEEYAGYRERVPAVLPKLDG